MTDDKKEKEAELQRRKEALEEELETYAQAGAYSPGLVKASRWVSRILYFVMAGALVFLLINRKEHTDADMQRAVDRANQIKKTADEAKGRMEQAETERDIAQTKLLLLEREMKDAREGVPAAEEARQAARDLILRAWGDRAYGEHWRAKLETAEPHAHGVEPLMGAKSLITQAAYAPAAQRMELLNEVSDFGQEAATQAVLELVEGPDSEIAAMAWRVGGWLGGEEIRAKAGSASGSVFADLAWSLIVRDAPPEGRWSPEAWVGYAMRAYDAPMIALVQAYRDAPEERRLALLALLAESADIADGQVFKSVAASDRPEAERILAVRWMGARKDEGSRSLLETLSEGSGAVAAEAKKALGMINDQ